MLGGRPPGSGRRGRAGGRKRAPPAADDRPAPGGAARRIPGAWHGSVPRAVLEAHFGRGALAVAARRPNFSRVFDLAERVIPREHHRRRVGRAEAQRELLLLAARAHGVGTAPDLADYYRVPIREARAGIAELVEAGELREVRIDGWRQPAYLHPDARPPRRIDAASLLSPFDPVIWTRARAAWLFELDYRIEIFVPAAKRRWGYYVLPFLLGERLVARVDLKADRSARRLLVPAGFLQPGTGAATPHPAAARGVRTGRLRVGCRAGLSCS